MFREKVIRIIRDISPRCSPTQNRNSENADIHQSHIYMRIRQMSDLSDELKNQSFKWRSCPSLPYILNLSKVFIKFVAKDNIKRQTYRFEMGDYRCCKSRNGLLYLKWCSGLSLTFRLVSFHTCGKSSHLYPFSRYANSQKLGLLVPCEYRFS